MFAIPLLKKTCKLPGILTKNFGKNSITSPDAWNCGVASSLMLVWLPSKNELQPVCLERQLS